MPAHQGTIGSHGPVQVLSPKLQPGPLSREELSKMVLPCRDEQEHSWTGQSLSGIVAALSLTLGLSGSQFPQLTAQDYTK